MPINVRVNSRITLDYVVKIAINNLENDVKVLIKSLGESQSDINP